MTLVGACWGLSGAYLGLMGFWAYGLTGLRLTVVIWRIGLIWLTADGLLSLFGLISYGFLWISMDFH